MSVFYQLRPTKLTENPQDHTAVVAPVKSLKLSDVISRVVWRGSTINRADILAVLEDYFDAIEELLLEGNNITTPLGNYRMSIRGLFQGIQDSFDASRHQVRVVVTPGQRLRHRVADRAQVEKQRGDDIVPLLDEYLDLNSGLTNGVITPGGLGQISGVRLKYNPANLQEGIFFVAADGSETRVQVASHNFPTSLSFLVPGELAAGTYQLVVRAVINDTAEVRKGTLSQTLTVGQMLMDPLVLQVP